MLFTAAIFAAAIFLSDDLSDYVSDGLRLSFNVIIPSVLPFLIITDFSVRFIRFERSGTLRRLFERIFKINGSVISVFICGILCGFPVGARLALLCYENGKISRGECERLMSFSNNASPGYVICAVGLGMRGSVTEGVILYAAMVLSSVIAGIIFRKKSNINDFNGLISEQRYSFIESVKSATAICVNVCGFVTVFGIICGMLVKCFGDGLFTAIMMTLLEIGNAGVYLSDLCNLSEPLSLALTAFAVSFSGLCVACQTLALLPRGSEISARKYFTIKLVQGAVSMPIALLLGLIT